MYMKNIRDTVKDNLIALRKQNKLTQMELAKKLNYSDKAISRWENGEVLPDVEILQSIADVYNIPLSYILEEKHPEDKKPKQMQKKYAVAVLSILALWTAITVGFVYLNIVYNYTFWQIFVWGVPITCVFMLVFNAKWQNSKILSLIFWSILCWSLIASFYLQYLQYNLWLVFLIGVPVQACVVVGFLMPKEDKE